MSGNIAAPYSELGIPGGAASLDLFSNPLMSSGILRSFYTELLPNAPISNTSSTISFDLDASPQMLHGRLLTSAAVRLIPGACKHWLIFPAHTVLVSFNSIYIFKIASILSRIFFW